MHELSNGNLMLADRTIGVLKKGENFFGFSSLSAAETFAKNEDAFVVVVLCCCVCAMLLCCCGGGVV